ncbi:MAG TPA: FecR family protein [Smithellaceae bacterium]|nr:FecR family protein [Smithellaceae bacterium]HRS84104.1 FecR family protein [Smithellaceae bacterium]HRV45668.1 FecR family protein [Smithellaceae bacterium]
MKKRTKIIVALLSLLLLGAAAQAQQPVAVKMTKGRAQITSLQGKVSMVCPGQTEAAYLKTYDFILPGCEIATGPDGLVEMVLPDRSVVRFAQKTKFKLIQADIGARGSRSVGISVTLGKIWSNVRKSLVGGGDRFEISCQNAVAGVRGTVYRMDVETDQSAVVKVYDGEVNVAGVSRTQSQQPVALGPPKPVAGPTVIEGPKPVSMEQWVYIVRSMQQIQITADGRAQKPRDFTEAEDMDDWVKWNKERDKQYGQ